MTGDEFWSSLLKPDGEDGCWYHPKYKPGKYTLVSVRGPQKGEGYFEGGAHRYALWSTGHDIHRRGAVVCHRCDNPPCCNPAHLFVGDARTNSADAIQKERVFGFGRQGVVGRVAFPQDARDALASAVVTSRSTRAAVMARYVIDGLRRDGYLSTPTPGDKSDG